MQKSPSGKDYPLGLSYIMLNHIIRSQILRHMRWA